MNSNHKNQTHLVPTRGEGQVALRKLTRRELARLSGGKEYSVIQTTLNQSECGSRYNRSGEYTWAGGKCYLERYM